MVTYISNCPFVFQNLTRIAVKYWLEKTLFVRAGRVVKAVTTATIVAKPNYFRQAHPHLLFHIA